MRRSSIVQFILQATLVVNFFLRDVTHLAQNRREERYWKDLSEKARCVDRILVWSGSRYILIRCGENNREKTQEQNK
jgi:hypothetical protein